LGVCVQVEATSERMSTLLDAKQRARTSVTGGSDSPAIRADQPYRPTPSTGESTPQQEAPRPAANKDPGNVAGELLKKRRERK